MENKEKITTIKLSDKTKARLDKLRAYPKESYESILKKTIDVLNICRVNPLKAKGRLAGIDRQNRRFRRGALLPS